jgi:hypothetical protein
MRVSNWRPDILDAEIASASMDRLRKAAEVIASSARSKCPVGTVSRPIYKSGPYANQPWTARDAGALKRTIRVVEKHDQEGATLAQGRNVRVYAGNYLVYYAKIVEYAGKKFLRPALDSSKDAVVSILKGGA